VRLPSIAGLTGDRCRRFYRSPDRLLDVKLRELGQTRAGFAAGSKFVFSQHCKAMRDVGFTDEQVSAIPSWSVADCFSPAERAVLAYTDCLVLQHGRAPQRSDSERPKADIAHEVNVTARVVDHARRCHEEGRLGSTAPTAKPKCELGRFSNSFLVRPRLCRAPFGPSAPVMPSRHRRANTALRHGA